MKVAAEMIPEESVGFKELRGDIMCKGPVAGGSMGRSSNWQKLRWFRCSEEVAVRPEAAGADHNSAHEALNAMVGSWHLWNLS